MSWLRRSYRILFVMASVSRIPYELIWWLSHPPWLNFGSAIDVLVFGEVFFTVPTIIVTVIAWRAPRAGAILACCWIPIGWAMSLYIGLFGGDLPHWSVAMTIDTILLTVGAVPAMVWGVRRMKVPKEEEISAT